MLHSKILNFHEISYICQEVFFDDPEFFKIFYVTSSTI